MSDAELERRASDAEAYRQDLVRGKNNASPPGNPLHPDTASEFSQRYGGALYQPENNNIDQVPTSGIQNVRMEVSETQRSPREKMGRKNVITKNTEQSEAGKVVLYNQKKSHLMFADKSIDWDGTGIPEEITEGSALEKVGYALGRRAAMTSAYVWTSFVYFTFQIWLGIIAAAAIGFVFLIEATVGGGTTQIIFDQLMSVIGVNWDFHLVALLCYMLVVVACYLQLFGVALQAKGLGLHPLGGSGGFLKTGTFLGCLVLYWVPIFNCLPLVYLYIASIQVSPR